jgi:ankyrin repeat protein
MMQSPTTIPQQFKIFLARIIRSSIKRTLPVIRLFTQQPFGKTDVITLLIADGAVVNVQNEGGRTALIQAAQFGNSDAVRILLAHGARTGFMDNSGKTALYYAKTWGHDDIARILMAEGATR